MPKFKANLSKSVKKQGENEETLYFSHHSGEEQRPSPRDGGVTDRSKANFKDDIHSFNNYFSFGGENGGTAREKAQQSPPGDFKMFSPIGNKQDTKRDSIPVLQQVVSLPTEDSNVEREEEIQMLALSHHARVQSTSVWPTNEGGLLHRQPPKIEKLTSVTKKRQAG